MNKNIFPRQNENEFLQNVTKKWKLNKIKIKKALIRVIKIVCNECDELEWFGCKSYEQ